MLRIIVKSRIARLGLSLVVAVIALLGWGSPSARSPIALAQAGRPGIAVSAHLGYGDDGTYLINEWFPIRVALSNPAGAPSTHVRVEVDSSNSNNGVAGTYAREVDLPSPSRKEITLYAFSSSFTSAFYVRLVQGSTVLGSTQVKATPLEPGGDAVVAVLSSEASLLNIMKGEHFGRVLVAFNSPNGYTRPGGPSQADTRANVAHIAPQDIPVMPVALNTLAGMVVEDADTGTLSKEQIAAISGWVADGGTLIVAPRVGGPELSPDLAALLPVKLSGTTSLTSLKSLGDLIATPITPAGSVAAYNATLRTEPGIEARSLASQNGVPLVAVRTLGSGQVAYLAVSPALPPLKGWDGIVPLFRRLLSEHRLSSTSISVRTLASNNSFNPYGSSYMSYGPYNGIFDTYGGLFDLPVLALPDPWGLALFLFIYILIIGPLNFIILRRFKRPELAWATIPALVLLFSVGAYLIGYQSKGGDLIMTRANLLRSVPGNDQAQAIQLWGLFSPLRSNYRINLGGDSLVSDLGRLGSYPPDSNPARVTGGDTTVIDNVRINTGSLSSFMAESTTQLASPLESDLHVGDNIITGTVRNTSDSGLQDVALIRGSSVQYIGYIASGKSVQVKLGLSLRAFDNSSPGSILPPPPGIAPYNPGNYSSSLPQEQRKYNRRLALLNAGLTSQLSNEAPGDLSVLAIAWGLNAPVGLSVEGHTTRTDELNLWTGPLPVVASSGAPVHLKEGTVPLTIFAPAATPQVSMGLPTGLLTLGPYADMQFRIPAGTKPESLRLTTNWPLPQGVDLLAYNVQSGAWDRLAGTAQSQDGSASLSLPSPAQYTGPAGDVTIRLASGTGNTDVPLSTFALAVNDKP